MPQLDCFLPTYSRVRADLIDSHLGWLIARMQYGDPNVYIYYFLIKMPSPGAPQRFHLARGTKAYVNR